MNKKTLAALTVVGVAAGYFAYHAIFKPDRPTVSFFDPQNCTYSVEGKKVTLENGYAEESAALYSSSKLITRYFGNDVTEDFNGDGLADSAFIITQDGGGSGTFYYAVVALNEVKGCKGTNAILLGDRIAPQTTEFQNNQIIVNYATRNPQDPLAVTPSVAASKYLKVEGATLFEIQK
jgi:hypothetical protein